MSHEIENNQKFYSLREPAWHRLGYVSDEVLSIGDALKAADMDFDWSLEDVHTTVLTPEGVDTLEIPGKKAVIRTNKRNQERTAYGPVGERYKPHSAQEIFSFIDDLQGGGAVVETVGSLGRGEREFVVVKLPNTITVGGTDRTDLYLTGTTAFDGTQSTQFDLTPVRVVCANTWRMAYRNSHARAKIRHTSFLDSNNAEKAKRVLELSTEYSESMTELGKRLLGTSVRDEDAAQVLANLFPFPETVTPGMSLDDLSTGEKRAVSTAQEQRQKVWTLYKHSETTPEQGTAWSIFNAVTEYVDWFSPVRGDDKETARAERILLGKSDQIKQQALDLLLV